MKLNSKQTPFDVILTCYKNNTLELLDADQRLQVERWNYIDNLIRTWQDSKTILGMHKAKWDISEATAYRDFANAKRFFGSLNIGEKDYYRPIYAEQLEEYAKLSASKGDYKTATAALKEAAEIRGLKDNDEVRDLYLDLEPSKFELSITINVNGQQKISTIDLNRLEDINDVDYVEVNEAVNTAVSVSKDEMIKLLNE